MILKQLKLFKHFSNISGTIGCCQGSHAGTREHVLSDAATTKELKVDISKSLIVS